MTHQRGQARRGRGGARGQARRGRGGARGQARRCRGGARGGRGHEGGARRRRVRAGGACEEAYCRRKLFVVKRLIVALGGNLLSGKLSDAISLLSLSKINLSEWGEGGKGRWEPLCFNLFFCWLPNGGSGCIYLWEGSWPRSWVRLSATFSPSTATFPYQNKNEPSLRKWGKCPVNAERDQRPGSWSQLCHQLALGPLATHAPTHRWVSDGLALPTNIP